MIRLTPESKETLRKCMKAINECKDKELQGQLRKNLAQNINYLHAYACNDGKTVDLKRTICELFSDFAPLSFFFNMKRKNEKGDYERWFVGGLIFHGAHDNGGGGGAPTFSVCLESDPGWSIHT